MSKKITRGTRSMLGALAEMKSYVDKGWTAEDVVAHYRKHHPYRIRSSSSVVLSEAGRHTAKSIKQLRLKLEVSQSVFARSLGVSTVLVQGWEQGVREPSPLARRLLDIVSRDPAAWLASLSVKPAAPKSRRVG